jgi:RNA polymerase sigma factor (sigma-70 family)
MSGERRDADTLLGGPGTAEEPVVAGRGAGSGLGATLDGYDDFCRFAYPPLVAALAHQTGDRWLAEELAQEALIRAGLRWSRVSRLSSPIGWTFAVGVNVGRSRFRRRAAERRAVARLRAAAANGWSVEHDRHENATVSKVARDRALQDLAPTQRTALLCRYHLDLSVRETSEVLQVSQGAVRALTHRAILSMRGALPNIPTAEEES